MDRATRAASLVTVAMAWLSFSLCATAWAGTPATLDDDASTHPKAAAADTSKKSVKSTSTTVAKSTPAKPAVKTAPGGKPATPPVTTTAAKPGTKPATVAKAGSVVTPTQSAPPVTRAGVPAGIPRVAPPTTNAASRTGTLARIPAGAKAPNTVAPNRAGIARVAPANPPSVPGAKAVALTPSISRAPSSKSTPVGSTLARSGGTTVNAPGVAGVKPSATASVTPIRPTSSVKAGAAMGAGVATRMAPGSKSGSTTASKSGLVVTAPLEDHVTYQYNALGRRDPFQSLMEGEYVGADVGGQAPPDLGGLKLVGIVWGSTDQFAMVEDVRGDSYVLRRGDRVMNGYVEGLKRDAMIVNINVDGQGQSVTIPITRKGEKNANR